MRPNNASIKPRHTTTENHPSPTLLLHLWHTKLRHEIRRPAIRAPGSFEILNTDFGERFDAGFQG
jgi:hypothetical protein